MYHGDIRLGDTIHIKFTTVGTDGAPTQLAGTPVVSAYPAASTTEITAGITLTADFDGRTGLNHLTVVATSGNGYATATNYTLVITTGTVGGTSVVGYVVGSFSIENRVINAAKIDTDAITAAKIAANAITSAKIAASAIGATQIATAAITAAKFGAGAIDAAAIGTAAIDADAIATDAITNAKIAAGAITSSEAPNLDVAVSSRLAPTVGGRTLDVSVTGEADANVVTWLGLAPNVLQAGRVDVLVGAMAANVMTATALATDAVNEIRDAVLDIVTGTADAGSDASNIVDAERTEAVADYWQHSVVEMTSGANVGQVRRIIAFNQTTDTITVAPAFKSAVGTGDTYRILRVIADGLRPVTEGNEATDVAADGDVGADVQTWLDAAVNVLIAGRVDADAQAMGTDVIGAAQIAAGAIGSSEAPNLDAAVSTRLAPTVAGRTLNVSVAGEGDANVVTWLAAAVNALISGRVDAIASVLGVDSVDAAALNADAVDEIWAEVLTELGVGAPSATPAVRDAIMLLYMALRNKVDVDASFKEIHNNAAAVIAKKALSDDGSTYSEATMVTGP